MRIMRFMGVVGALGLVCAGCTAPAKFPLQPGEEIIFRDGSRAAEYRQESGNDSYGSGRAVLITRPTIVELE